MELLLMTLVVPMFGIFGMLGGLGQMVGSLLGKQITKKGLPPAPVGGILPTVAMLFAKRAKEKQGNQPTDQMAADTQPTQRVSQRDMGQRLRPFEGWAMPQMGRTEGASIEELIQRLLGGRK